MFDGDGGVGKTTLAIRIRVLEHPWTLFTFADGDCRRQLAEHVREHDVDLVIAGPVTSIGMDTAGTAQQVRESDDRLEDVRRLADRRVAFLLVHHEKKGGKLSAPGKVLATACSTSCSRGRGASACSYRKPGGRPSTTPGRCCSTGPRAKASRFVDAEPDRSERVWEGIEAYVLAHGGTGWNNVDKAVPGQGDYPLETAGFPVEVFPRGTGSAA